MLSKSNMGTYSPRTWLVFISQQNEEITKKLFITSFLRKIELNWKLKIELKIGSLVAFYCFVFKTKLINLFSFF